MVMSLVVDGLRMRLSVRKTELPLTLPTTESQTSFANALLAKISRDTRTRALRRMVSSCRVASILRRVSDCGTCCNGFFTYNRAHEALLDRTRSVHHAARVRAVAPRGEVHARQRGVRHGRAAGLPHGDDVGARRRAEARARI